MHLICDDSSWLVDSWTSAHVSDNSAIFSTCTTGDCRVLKMKIGNVSKAIAIEDVHLKANTSYFGVSRCSSYPKYPFQPHVGRRLDGEGFFGLFENEQLELTKGSMVVIWGSKKSDHYYMEESVHGIQEMKVNSDAFTKLWHRRLSHINEKEMSYSANCNVLPRLKRAKLERCTNYTLEKQHRVSFQSCQTSRKLALLGLIHLEVCNPIKIKSIGGASYFITFINNCSKKIWIYVLKTKDQVLHTFNGFMPLLETSMKMKCVHSDNRDEYLGLFNAYYREQGYNTRSLRQRQLNSMT